jgi:thiamine kinase-like enzyme
VTTQQVAATLAALHAPALTGPHTLPPFERSRPAETGYPFLNAEHRALQTLVTKLSSAAKNFCIEGLVHGDYSRRNLLVHHQLITGLVDFERSGEGCRYEDLATVYLHDGLIDGHDNDELIVCYQRSLQTHLARQVTVHREHLLFHVAAYASWILQWAAEVDKPLADTVSRLIPAIIGKLNNLHGWTT